uniref:Uncharacterized protein n=1 Tax=Romanomermis culicivorax TaxID=13658 RepID=A0A915HJG8_ROMCU
MDRQLHTIQDHLESHPEDPNYVPPSKKCRDSREDTRSREQKETDSRTREQHSWSTARKESDDYDSRKNCHGEYASDERPRKYHRDRDYR